MDGKFAEIREVGFGSQLIVRTEQGFQVADVKNRQPVGSLIETLPFFEGKVFSGDGKWPIGVLNVALNKAGLNLFNCIKDNHVVTFYRVQDFMAKVYVRAKQMGGFYAGEHLSLHLLQRQIPVTMMPREFHEFFERCFAVLGDQSLTLIEAKADSDVEAFVPPHD